MEYRASVENMVEYIEGRSEEIYQEILADNPDFKRTIQLSFDNNIQCVRSELRDIADKFPTDMDLIDNPNDKSKGRYHCSDYINLPHDTDQMFESHARNEANQANREFLKATPPSYPEYKKFLRNMMLWNYQSSRNTSEFHYSDKQFRAVHRMSADVKLEDSKFSAVVWVEHQNDDGNYAEKVEVYKIPALKLSKFLKKIEMSDKFVTKVASRISNVPKTLTLCFTDKYIPEAYMLMSSKVSSCMAYGADSYGLPSDEHPVLPYEGSPDVYLALVKDEDSEAEFPFINRAIVLKSDWSYDTCYGNQLMHDLSPYGLDQSCNMSGIRLALIESSDGGILAPYVDGTDCRYYESNGYLVCCDDMGERQSCYDSGRLGGEYYCEFCDGYYDETVETEDCGNVCDNCIENNFIELDYEWVLYDDTCEGEDSSGYSIRLRDCDAVYSDHHSTYIPTDSSFFSDKVDSYLHDSDDEDDIFNEMHEGCSCDLCCPEEDEC